MLNNNIYKLFNPELNNFNNNKLLIHWKNIGLKEGKIFSLESFFNKYPYYDHDSYKLYNPDLNINDKIELMIHWHLYGISQNRICSNKYFEILYPNFNTNIENINKNNLNIYTIKNEFHKNIIDKNLFQDNNLQNNNLHNELNNNNLPNEKKELNYNNLLLNFLLNPNKIILSLYICENNYDINYFLKCFSLINFYNMNIIVFCDNEKIINSLNFINNISIFTHTFNEKDKLILFSLSKYLITNNININFSNNFKNINLSYNINKYYHLEKIFIPFEYINNINYSSKFIILDNYLDNYYFENNFLISYNNSYIINENNLYIINHQNKINNENIYNKLYITHNYLSKLTINYQYIFEPKLIFTNNIKIIKFKNKDLFNYGIVEYNNNYYYKIFNHYSLINLDDIILNLPIDFNFIYVEEKFENIICTNNFLNLKINLIFMINKDNLKNSEYNIRTLLNQTYNY